MLGGFFGAFGGEGQSRLPGKDGKIAYFDRSESGDYDIYSMKSDGTDRKRLTEDTANDYAPDLSPSGKKIAFASLGRVPTRST